AREDEARLKDQPADGREVGKVAAPDLLTSLRPESKTVRQEEDQRTGRETPTATALEDASPLIEANSGLDRTRGDSGKDLGRVEQPSPSTAKLVSASEPQSSPTGGPATF